MMLCKTKPPFESHRVELILAQWFENVVALYQVIGQRQDKQLARSLCQNDLSQNYCNWFLFVFSFALVDLGLSTLTPKKWFSHGVQKFCKYVLES